MSRIDTAVTGKIRRSRGSGQTRIEDVARAAGVSSQTVSRYLRSPSLVSADTAARLRSCIETIGYVPNLIAGSLASNRSRILAILVPTVANPVHAAPIQGLSDAVREAGYQVLVGTTDYDPLAEQALVETFLGRRVDGIVLTGTASTAQTRQMLARSAIPVVQLWELPDDPIDMAVGVSNHAIGACVARHFIERGRSRPALICHAAAGDTRAAARAAGFRAALTQAGLAPPRELAAERPVDLEQAPALLSMLREAEADAVFCVGDQLAVGLLLACRHAGIAIPGELAIAGVGNSDIASLIIPSLTTVEIPRYGLGHTAGRMLLGRFGLLSDDTDAPRGTVDLGFRLIVRDSS